MKGFRIIDIFKVLSGDTLLELHINVESANKKLSFKLSISDDGETILFGENEGWVTPSDINYEAYSVVKVDENNDGLAGLLDNIIGSIQYGIGKTLDTNKNVIYYIKINTNKKELLFFNNGDRGAYSFDNIGEILKNDIYGYEWTEHVP